MHAWPAVVRGRQKSRHNVAVNKLFSLTATAKKKNWAAHSSAKVVPQSNWKQCQVGQEEHFIEPEKAGFHFQVDQLVSKKVSI